MVDHKGNEIKKGRRGGRECIRFDGEQGKNALAGREEESVLKLRSSFPQKNERQQQK